MSKMCCSLKKWTSKLCTMYNYPHPSLLPFPWVCWGVNWVDDLFSANSPLTFYKNINAKLIAGGFQPTHWCLDQSEFFKIFTIRAQTPVLKNANEIIPLKPTPFVTKDRKTASRQFMIAQGRASRCLESHLDFLTNHPATYNRCYNAQSLEKPSPTGFYRMRIIWFPAFPERTKCFSHSLTFWV